MRNKDCPADAFRLRPPWHSEMISPLRRSDVPAMLSLAPHVIRCATAAEFEKHLLDNPYFSSDSLFALRDRGDGFSLDRLIAIARGRTVRDRSPVVYGWARYGCWVAVAGSGMALKQAHARCSTSAACQEGVLSR